MKRYGFDTGHHVTGSEQDWRVDEDVNGDWVKYEDIKHLLNAPKNTLHNSEYKQCWELLFKMSDEERIELFSAYCTYTECNGKGIEK